MAAHLSARAAAARCGVSERTLRRWIADGRLPAAKVDGAFRIAAADLEMRDGQAPQHAAANAEGGAPHAATPQQEAQHLADLVRELQRELVQTTAAAAMWQERARGLEQQLALPAPAAPNGAESPQGPPAPAETTTASPRPWWRFW